MTRSQFGCTPAAATPSSSRVVFVITLVGALVMGACGHARQKATEEVERLNRAALADFKKGKLQDARKGLLEAVRVGKAGEVEPALLARSHVALGAVYAGQPKDADKAIAHMAAALERDPAIKLPKSLATPAARKALGAARRGEKGGAAPAAKPRDAEPVVAAAPPPPRPQPAAALPAPVAPPPVAPSSAPAAPVAARPEPAPGRLTQPLSCRVPEEAPPENEIMFRCAVRGDARVSKVLLHYRPAGSELFTEVPMARNKRGWYTGVAPASATAGKMLQYWVEGRGATPVSNGTSESPNLILVREGAAPAGPDDPVPGRTPADDDDDDRPSSVNEDPLAAIARERELARDREGRNRRDAGNVFVAFGFGSGFGWQPGGSLEFRDDQKVDPGPLPGGLVHLLPEVGYQLSDDFAVSLQARLQFLPAQGAGDPKAGSPQEKAFAALVRAVWAFGPANLRGFFSGCAGAGDGFRLRVPADRGVGLIRSDTVRGGPLLAGAGAGVAYHISQHLAWSTELRALVGLPTVAAIAELSTGLEVGF